MHVHSLLLTCSLNSLIIRRSQYLNIVWVVILCRSAYILKQESLPSSYKSFLNKHGGKDVVILQGIKEIASNKPFTDLAGIEKCYKTMGVDVKLDPKMKVPCSVSIPQVHFKCFHVHKFCQIFGFSSFLPTFSHTINEI